MVYARYAQSSQHFRTKLYFEFCTVVRPHSEIHTSKSCPIFLTVVHSSLSVRSALSPRAVVVVVRWCLIGPRTRTGCTRWLRANIFKGSVRCPALNIIFTMPAERVCSISLSPSVSPAKGKGAKAKAKAKIPSPKAPTSSRSPRTLEYPFKMRLKQATSLMTFLGSSIGELVPVP